MLTPSDIRLVNRIHRENDDSQLWPINGKFNVTERAIKQARYIRRESDECYDAEHYNNLLCDLESQIVNNERNW